MGIDPVTSLRLCLSAQTPKHLFTLAVPQMPGTVPGVWQELSMLLLKEGRKEPLNGQQPPHKYHRGCSGCCPLFLSGRRLTDPSLHVFHFCSY